MAFVGYLAKFNFSDKEIEAWWRLRAKFRSRATYCKFCGYVFKPKEVKIVDHKKPHKGDLTLLLDVNNLQVLCKRCHDSRKQIIENRMNQPTVGLDGWQI